MSDVRKPSLTPGGRKAEEALREANKIVADSPIGQFLNRNDAPDGYAHLVGKVFDVIVDTNG